MRRLSLALAAAFGLAVLAGALAWSYATWRDRAELGLAAREMTRGANLAARDRLARLAARRPGDGEVRFRLGACEQALGRPDAALRAWEKVPPGSSFGAEAALRRAGVLTRDFGRLADAEVALAAALGGPAEVAVRARWALFELLVWEGRLDEARRLLEAGWDAAGRADRDARLRQHAKLDGAVVTREDVAAVLDAAARHAPDDPRVRLVRAALATRSGRHDEARRETDALRAARPDDPVTWRARLDGAVAAGRPVEAAEALGRLPEGTLSPRTLLSLRAWAAERRGDAPAERRFLNALSVLDPGDPAPLDRLAALAGDAATAADLRRRKAGLDQARERYRWSLVRLPPETTRPQAEELSRLAESTGRDFEAQGWWSLAVSHGAGAHAPGRLARLARARRTPEDATIPLARLAAELAAAPAGAVAGTTPDADAAADAAPLEFVDDAERSGLVFTYQSPRSPRLQVPEVMGGGAALLDFDGDGRLDVFLVQGGPRFPPDPVADAKNGDRLFRNRGGGVFEDVSEAAGLPAVRPGFGFGVASGDYDNDGKPDLFLSRWGAYVLLHNRGDGTFEDATARAGLGGDRGWPTSAAFADLDGDGDLDLFVCHYLVWDAADPPVCRSARIPGRVVSCLPRAFRAEPDRLFRNDGGRFVDVTAEAGIADRDGRGLGVVAADLDGDGRTDLYVANDQSANALYRNRGGMKFEEAGFASGAACGADGAFRAGMGVACGDLDGDGRPDLVVTNFYRESTTFFRNLGGGAFTDRTVASGLAGPSLGVLGFGVALLDADNDGRLDLATANGHVNDERPAVPYAMPSQLFRGLPGGRLADVSGSAGPPWRREVIGRGLVAGDLDNDGRVDALIVPQNGPLIVARNVTDAGHSLTFRLQGAASNRDGVGATVTVHAGGRRLRAWRVGGGSYQSSSDPRLHFGLGSARAAERVDVTWPSGRVDRHRDLPADAGYLLREGDTSPSPLAGFGRAGSRSPEADGNGGPSRFPRLPPR